MMLRSVFNCCSSNKVEDDKTAIDLRQGRGTVFIFVSTNVLCRSLLGAVIQALELKGLTAEKIEFKSADPTKFQKSALFKNPQKAEKFTPLGVFMIWKGENAFARVSEVLHRVGNEHTIPKVDILFTQSPNDTKKEVDLWFDKPVEDKRNGEVAAAPAAAEEAVPQADEIPAEPGETAEQGDHLTVPPTDTRPSEPAPGYEDAVTEEAHEIHPQPPAPPPPQEPEGERKEQQQQ